MGEFSIFHWMVVLAIVLILFGGRKIPEVMKGLGEGIRNFKDGMAGSQSAGSTTSAVASPNGLTAKAGAGEVVLNWIASPGVSTYNVKRSGTSGGPYARIGSIAATTHTDGGLVSGSTFYYVVSAATTTGESENSVEVSATTA